MEVLIIIGLAILVAVNLAASWYVSSAPAYERSQKKVQIVLIWAIPFLGAAFFSAFLWHDRKTHALERQIGNNTSISNSDAINHYMGANHRGGR